MSCCETESKGLRGRPCLVSCVPGTSSGVSSLNTRAQRARLSRMVRQKLHMCVRACAFVRQAVCVCVHVCVFFSPPSGLSLFLEHRQVSSDTHTYTLTPAQIAPRRSSATTDPWEDTPHPHVEGAPSTSAPAKKEAPTHLLDVLLEDTELQPLRWSRTLRCCQMFSSCR